MTEDAATSSALASMRMSKSVNLPRILVTTAWRATKPSVEWAGSAIQIPDKELAYGIAELSVEGSDCLSDVTVPDPRAVRAGRTGSGRFAMAGRGGALG